MFAIYLISAILCFLLCLLASKVHDGEVLVRDVVFSSVSSVVPIWNSALVIVASFFILKGTVENYGDKKLF